MTLQRVGELFARKWDQFFFAPFDLKLVALFRVGVALLLLVNFFMLGLDLNFFMGPDGVMPLAASREIINPRAHTIFELLPDTQFVLRSCYALALTHSVCLLLGIFPRLQAFCVFLWTLWFQNRNFMIFDCADQLLRMFAFFLAFLPSQHFYSLHAWLRERRDEPAPERFGSAWALRLVQLQMTLVYVGWAISGLRGGEWRDGVAMWYVTRLHDAFGNFPLPHFVLSDIAMLLFLTWAILLVECLIPIGLWIARTRRVALVAALSFHFFLWYSMNLFLFQPLMIVGLLCFVATDANLSPAWRQISARVVPDR